MTGFEYGSSGVKKWPNCTFEPMIEKESLAKNVKSDVAVLISLKADNFEKFSF